MRVVRRGNSTYKDSLAGGSLAHRRSQSQCGCSSTEGQILQGLVGSMTDFGFYSESHRKPQKEFKWVRVPLVTITPPVVGKEGFRGRSRSEDWLGGLHSNLTRQ